MNLIYLLIFIIGYINACHHLTFEMGYISIGIKTVNLQDGGHRFYKKFSGHSDIYAIIDSEYPNGEDCISFDANIFDINSSVGIYNFANIERTVLQDAALYYYPIGSIAKSYEKGEGTKNLETLASPVETKKQYKNLMYKINRNTGTIGFYQDKIKIKEFQTEYFKTGYNFMFVDLRK